MKEIKIDDKTYVLKEDVDKEIAELVKQKLAEENPKGKESEFRGFEVNIMDEANIMGMGSAEIGNDWKIVDLSLDMLKKSIKCVESLSYGKAKRERITLGISHNQPLCIGDISKKSNSRWFSGVFLAPRIEDDLKK